MVCQVVARIVWIVTLGRQQGVNRNSQLTTALLSGGRVLARI